MRLKIRVDVRKDDDREPEKGFTVAAIRICRTCQSPSQLLSREGRSSYAMKRKGEMDKDPQLQADKSPELLFGAPSIDEVEFDESFHLQAEKISSAAPERTNCQRNNEEDVLCEANEHFQLPAQTASTVFSAASDIEPLIGQVDCRTERKQKKRKVWSFRRRRRKSVKKVKLSCVSENMRPVSNVEADVFHESFIEGDEEPRARDNASCSKEDIQNPVLCLSDEENEMNRVQEIVKADPTSERVKEGIEEPHSISTNSITAGKFAYPSRDDPEAVEVLVSDLQHLQDFVFLNDTVIDFYIKYLQSVDGWREDLRDRLHFYNSFFYKKLCEAVQSQKREKNDTKMRNLRKWTKGINIFEKSYLFFPIHDNSHWSLAVICLSGASTEPITHESCCILHFDSMDNGHRSQAIYRVLKSFLVAELEFQNGSEGTTTNAGKRKKIQERDIPAKRVKVPLQENQFDCGLFLLHFIDCFVKEASPTLTLNEAKNKFGRDWFPPQDASKKRETIRKLIEDLLRDQGTDRCGSPLKS